MGINILHFGLNRSGTNYLKELVDNHFDVIFLNTEEERDHPLHKHFRLYDDKSLIGRPNFINDKQFRSFAEFEQILPAGSVVSAYIIISKDPYSWNLSYRNWGIKNNWPASPHPFILEYNAFYGKWLQFSKETDKIAFVRYIDLLSDPEATLGGLRDRFNLPEKKKISKIRRVKKVPMSHRFSASRVNYYLQEKYLDDYKTEELEELNRHLDHDLIQQLGYQSRPLRSNK